MCDNLAFNADLYVSKKHTRFGKDRFDEGIAKSIRELSRFRQLEARRIETYQTCEISENVAASALLHAYEQGILSSQTLPVAIKEWRDPSHVEFLPRTAWSWFNGITEALKPHQSNQQKFAAMTMKLYGLVDKMVDFTAAV